MYRTCALMRSALPPWPPAPVRTVTMHGIPARRLVPGRPGLGDAAAALAAAAAAAAAGVRREAPAAAGREERVRAVGRTVAAPVDAPVVDDADGRRAEGPSVVVEADRRDASEVDDAGLRRGGAAAVVLAEAIERSDVVDGCRRGRVPFTGAGEVVEVVVRRATTGVAELDMAGRRTGGGREAVLGAVAVRAVAVLATDRRLVVDGVGDGRRRGAGSVEVDVALALDAVDATDRMEAGRLLVDRPTPFTCAAEVEVDGAATGGRPGLAAPAWRGVGSATTAVVAAGRGRGAAVVGAARREGAADVEDEVEGTRGPEGRAAALGARELVLEVELER